MRFPHRPPRVWSTAVYYSRDNDTLQQLSVIMCIYRLTNTKELYYPSRQAGEGGFFWNIDTAYFKAAPWDETFSISSILKI